MSVTILDTPAIHLYATPYSPASSASGKRAVVVLVHVVSDGGVPPTSLTWGDSTLKTPAQTVSNGVFTGIALFVYKESEFPTSLHDLTYANAGVTHYGHRAFAFTCDNVDQTTPLRISVGTQVSTTATPSVAQASITIGDLVVGMAFSEQAGGSSPNNSFTEILDYELVFRSVGSDYKVAAATTENFSLTFAGGSGAQGALAFTLAQYVAAPAITSVDSDNAFASDGTALPVVGTGMGANSGARTFKLSDGVTDVTQSQGSGDATSGSISSVSGYGLGELLPFGALTFKCTVGSGTGTKAVTVSPPSGHTYTLLSTLNTDAVRRITAIPDLVSGQQVETRNVLPSGTASINPDGTYDTDGTSFEVRRLKAVDGWSDWATQTVAAPSNGARAKLCAIGVSGVQIF